MAQHSVVSSAIIYYYPSWLRRYGLLILKPSIKQVQHLNKEFNLEKPLNTKECPLFLRTLCYYFKEQFPDDYFDFSICENYVCKYFQTADEKKTNQKQHDLYLPRQPVFDVSEEVIIHHSLTQTESISDGCLIRRYAFGKKKMLSIREIALQCNLPLNIRSLRNFNVEPELRKRICYPDYAVEHNFYEEVSHHVKRLPEMNSDGRAFADLIISK